jgi:hypothetical protein
MNSLTVFGRIVSEPWYREKQDGDAAKIGFTVEVPTRILPLRFSAIAFGEPAERIRYAAVDTWFVAVGKLEGGYDPRSKVPTMTFFIREFSSLEINSGSELPQQE